ncbi:MAG TPA: lysozyme inhibitor LprI family protein [Chthoniobacteraceae bacterium]|nr:lysozyme inhibitor LprI family protein [Chthoniobacteraceae bacterium]
MNTIRNIALALLLAAVAGRAAAEGAGTLDSSRAKFAKRDTELNAVYKLVLNDLGKADATRLRADEKRWLSYRDTMSEAAPRFNTGRWPADPKSTVYYWNAMADYTAERIEFLRAWTGSNVPPGITGSYSDCYGASLDLEETKAGVKFHLVAVRGSAGHIGEIKGVIHPKDGTAYFKGEANNSLKLPPCELIFKFAGGHIVNVVEETRDPDAGAGVSYAGSYYKIGKLRKS